MSTVSGVSAGSLTTGFTPTQSRRFPSTVTALASTLTKMRAGELEARAEQIIFVRVWQGACKWHGSSGDRLREKRNLNSCGGMVNEAITNGAPM